MVKPHSLRCEPNESNILVRIAWNFLSRVSEPDRLEPQTCSSPRVAISYQVLRTTLIFNTDFHGMTQFKSYLKVIQLESPHYLYKIEY